MRAALALLLVTGCDALFGLQTVTLDPDARHGDGKSTDAKDANGDLRPDAFVDPSCKSVGLTCASPALFSISTSCYVACREQVTYATAQARCQAWGGSLMILASAQEDSLIQQSFGDTTTFWMGMKQLDLQTKPDDGWQWNTGDPVTFFRWYTNDPFGVPEPNDGGDKFENGEEQCGWYSTLGWGDGDCGTGFQFLCKK